MYRYLLFVCQKYYPSGGMEDCVLKTNNYSNLVPFINANYSEEPYNTIIHYYDTVEDKIWYAEMRIYQNEYRFDRQKFVGWSEEEL